MIARLRPGATRGQAEAQLSLLIDEVRREGAYGRESGVRVSIVPLQEGVTQTLRQPLKILWAAVVAVFILGSANAGGMLLARSSGRAGELATRLALGASPGRIVRQLLLESTIIGLMGGAAGILVGRGALGALRALGRNTFPFLESVDMDWRVLLATLGLTMISGIACGLLPSLQVGRIDLRSVQGGSRGIAGSRRFLSLGALVGGQVALTVPLLVGAGLLLHTFLYLWNLDPGFDTSHVLTARFSLQDARYSTAVQVGRLYDTVVARLHETPGIEAAAVALTLPYERALNQAVRLPGQMDYQMTNAVYVTAEYFRALRIPILQGRDFTSADGAESTPVAVVNLAFSHAYLKGQGALGQLIRLGGRPVEIVGVAGNVQNVGAGWGDYGPIAQVPTVYVPVAQVSDGELRLFHVWFTPSWIVRSPLGEREIAAAIDRALRSVDPLLPVAAFRSIREVKTQSLEEEGFLAALVDAFGALAILLVALGVYGLTANLAAEKTRQMGIRMALGSTSAQAVRSALGPTLKWVLAGAVVGTGVAVGTERFLRSYLWGVDPFDPVTVEAVALGLLAVTGLASLVPAARIARLNPADTLRAA